MLRGFGTQQARTSAITGAPVGKLVRPRALADTHRGRGAHNGSPALCMASFCSCLREGWAAQTPAGLLAGIATLDAAQTLAEQWQLGMEARWGMSPFGGSTSSAVWEAVDARMFLQPEHRGASRVQAAFRAAYHLPSVATVAVGSDDAEHLRELIDALHLNASEATVRQYRKLLRDRSRRQRAWSSPTIRSAATRAGASLGSASSAQRPTTFVQ